METVRNYRVFANCYTSCGESEVLLVCESDFDDWLSGSKLIQRALPYLSAGQRELLISGLCEECFGRVTGFDDERPSNVIKLADRA